MIAPGTIEIYNPTCDPILEGEHELVWCDQVGAFVLTEHLPLVAVEYCDPDEPYIIEITDSKVGS